MASKSPNSLIAVPDVTPLARGRQGDTSGGQVLFWMFEREPAVGFPAVENAVLPGKPEEPPDQGELECHAEILTLGIKTPGAIVHQSTFVRTPGMVNDAFVEHWGVGKALNIRQLSVSFRHARRVCEA